MIQKGDENWSMMADLYKLYNKATDCQNPSITTRKEWLKQFDIDVNEFYKKYRDVCPIAHDFAMSLAKYVAYNTVNE